jgi:Putative zincin peptidase
VQFSDAAGHFIACQSEIYKMRAIFGMPSDNPTFDPAGAGWNIVASSNTSRPSLLVILIVASVASFFAAMAAWSVWVPNAWHGTFTQAYPLDSFLVCLVVGTVVHESLHLFAHPFFGLSAQSVVGFWPKLMTPYVLFDGPIARNRLVIVLLTPFLALSVFPFLLAVFTSYSNAYVTLIAIINASGSLWDIHRAIVVATYIPANAEVRGYSGYLWWHKFDGSDGLGSN